MAEVVTPDPLNGLAGSSLGSMVAAGAPRIEMVRNPDFSFPRQVQPSGSPRRRPAADETQRPSSMRLNLAQPQGLPASHRRAVSTLPSFTFNSADNSGLTETTPPVTPPASEETAPITPSRRGHRRGGSEFVGGDSRFGVSNALSSSPTKSSALPVPAPASATPSAGRRGHAHRRSAAMSSHDVSSIMQPSEAVPRLSQSLPNTPMELPDQKPPLDRTTSAPEVVDALTDPFGPPLDEESARPPSRPRVGFDDNVTIIPRPLSTISSETESSMCTIRGHSYNNSISSVISMSTPSPPSARTPRMSLSSTIEEHSARTKSSLEISRRIEKEGEWLKSRSSGSLKRPHSEMIMPSQTTKFVLPEATAQPQRHHKKHSFGHALGFDRRKSEPTMGMSADEASRLSALSLQESNSSSAIAGTCDTLPSEQKSSARRIKQWAASKMHRKSKEACKPRTASSSGSSRPVSEGSTYVAGKVPVPESPVAETDLDAVLGSDVIASEAQRPGSQARAELSTPTPSQHSSFFSSDNDDPSSMLDLDAALGPFKTPPIGPHRHRKELHSDRLAKDFTGPGGHYHRRTESAPALPPFDGSRVGTPPQPSMADVFEEEEEEDSELNSHMLPPSVLPSTRPGAEDEANVGVEIVDLDSTVQDTVSSPLETGLGIQRASWEPERPTTSHGNTISRLSTIGTDHRPSSVIEETIMEESSPVEVVEIVEAHEEPRASSLTKSSDSSETPTILAAPGMLTLPDGMPASMTPETFQTSTFSSPDFAQRQTSFDTTRLGTSASSMTDNRTMSSYGEPVPDLRVSVDDVPSLTSSRSTMLSTAHANTSRRDFTQGTRTPSATSAAAEQAEAAQRRRKRGSIQSLSQLVGGSFISKTRSGGAGEESRPQTAIDSAALRGGANKKEPKEHRLKKLMFWKAKQGAKSSTT